MSGPDASVSWSVVGAGIRALIAAAASGGDVAAQVRAMYLAMKAAEQSEQQQTKCEPAPKS